MKECPTCKLCFNDSEVHCPTDGSSLNFVFAGNVVLEDRYQLEQCIGRGGMGVVYKGRHILLKTLHAIKVILPELVGGDPGLVRRFRQEAMVAASIRHQNIVTVTDFGVVGEKMPFIVMDFIKGELLHDLLEREGKLPPPRVLEIISAIASGVGTAHTQGIIHRDLKPLNVMLQDNLSVADGLKILDFGLAKIKSGDVFGSFVLAQTTGLMGSPYYMAPEQWSEDEPDARADIYSMGIMLYQMLAGQVPFRGPSVPVIMKKHMFDLPPTFASLGADVSSEVDMIVRRCLEKDPANRPQTVEELIGEFREAIGHSYPLPHVRATRETAAPARRRSTRTTKDKVAHSDPAVRASGSRKAKATKDELEQLLKQAEQERLLAEAKARAEEEARKRAEHERMLLAERERAEEEARRRADLERRLSEERARAEAERQRQEDLARRLEAARKRQESGDGIAFPPSTLAKLDETSPPQSLAPHTLPQMSMHPEAFMAASGSSLKTQETQPQEEPELRIQDTMAESIPTLSVSRSQDAVIPPPNRAPLFVGVGVGAVVVLLVIGFAIYMFMPRQKTAEGNTAAPIPTTMAAVPGGSFMMGSNVTSDDLDRQAEYPAHAKTIGPFVMDKTEVTSAEYAGCVKGRICSRPSNWTSDEPPKGHEKWPVTNVSVDDAQAFASWRSKRDGVEYRLPSEEEWEFAARSGNNDYFYPWGKQWIGQAANVASKSPQAVGSYPSGASAQGILDLIGNVYEWTSSQASVYPGNQHAMNCDPKDKIIRGGCYANQVSGKDSVTATSRRCANPTDKSECLGFRLVTGK